MAKKVKTAISLNNNSSYSAQSINVGDQDAILGDDKGLACMKLFQVTSVEGLKCLNTLPIFLQGSEENIGARIVAMSATEDLNLIVVGLSNGRFILYRGNIFGGMMKTSSVGSFTMNRNSSHKTYERLVVSLSSSPTESFSPITNIHFCHQTNVGVDASSRGIASTNIYVTTSKQIYSYLNVNDRRAKLEPSNNKIVLDAAFGAERNCTAITASGLLSVAREDGIFMYDSEDKGPCYSSNNPKTLIRTFGKYSCVVSLERGLNRLSVYDLQLKFVGLTMTMRAGTSNRASLNMASNANNDVGNVSENTLSSDRHNLQLAALMHSDGKILDILDTAGTLFVLTSTRRLYALDEKTMDEKLSDLYKKHMYHVALKITVNTTIDNRLIYQKLGIICIVKVTMRRQCSNT